MPLSSNEKIVSIIIIALLIVLGGFSYDKSDFESSTEILATPQIRVKTNNLDKK